jgi:hypothetical protein
MKTSFEEKTIEQAREAFEEIERIVVSHREANRVPTLSATDLQDSADKLVEAIQRLNREEYFVSNDSPKLDKNAD